RALPVVALARCPLPSLHRGTCFPVPIYAQPISQIVPPALHDAPPSATYWTTFIRQGTVIEDAKQTWATRKILAAAGEYKSYFANTGWQTCPVRTLGGHFVRLNRLGLGCG